MELSEVDVAIVSLGERMDVITLAALHLLSWVFRICNRESDLRGS